MVFLLKLLSQENEVPHTFITRIHIDRFDGGTVLCAQWPEPELSGTALPDLPPAAVRVKNKRTSHLTHAMLKHVGFCFCYGDTFSS